MACVTVRVLLSRDTYF